MEINRAIDDSINNSEPLKPNPLRSEVLYQEPEEDLDRLQQVGGGFGSSMTSRRRIWIIYDQSEEDLDHLLQVGEGLANIHQRTAVLLHPPRLIGPHHQRHTFIKRPSWPVGASILVGRAKALEGHESSKLPGSTHLFAPQSW
jgi:hypothetical protein